MDEQKVGLHGGYRGASHAGADRAIIRSMRYYRRRWTEARDDRRAWGPSTWYFAADEAGIVVKQIEVYDNGTVLIYDEHHVEDQYGRLSDVPLDAAEFQDFAVDADVFGREADGLSRRMDDAAIARYLE